MGSKQEKLLVYLDREMVKLQNKGKIGVFFGTIIIGGHFCYKMALKYQEKQQKMQAMLQDTDNTKSK